MSRARTPRRTAARPVTLFRMSKKHLTRESTSRESGSRGSLTGKHKAARLGALEVLLVLLPLITFAPLSAPPVFMDSFLPTKDLAFMLAALAAAGLAAWQFFRRPAAAEVPRLELAVMLSLGVYLAWQLTSLAWAPNVGYGMRDAGRWLGVGVFLFLGLRRLTERSAEWLQYSLAAAALVLSLTQIVEHSKGNVFPSVFFNYGITAELLATMLPLQVAACLGAKPRALSVLSGVSAVFGWLAICETLRRGAMAGALLALIVLAAALLTRQFRARSWQAAASLAAALALVSALQFSGLIGTTYDLKARLNDAGVDAAEGGGGNSSLFERTRYWVVGSEMARRHPLTGVGVAGFSSLYSDYRRFYVENPRHDAREQMDASNDEFAAGLMAHNEYVQVLAELGWPGLILFLTFAALLAWLLWRRRGGPLGYLNAGAFAGLAAFAVSSGVSSFSFRQSPTAAVAVCLMALGAAGIGREKESSREKEASGENAPGSVTLPKAAVAAALCLALALSLVFSWRSLNSLEGIRLQAATEGKFSPTDPRENERWLAESLRIYEHDPYNRGAHLGTAILLFRMKRPQEAAAHLEAAIRLGYTRPLTRIFLAFAYEQSGQLDKAVAQAETSLASFPKSLFARAAYIEFLRQRGDMERMRREMDTLKRQKPELAEAHPWIMRTHLMKAEEEARKLNRPSPYKALPGHLERGVLQMRAFHYLE
jgi:O-antigen ligase